MTLEHYKGLLKLPFLGLFVFAIVLGLSGCETIEGAGRDIENAGDSISDAANDAK